MKDAPAGKYVVQINPGGEYGGQTLVDYGTGWQLSSALDHSKWLNPQCPQRITIDDANLLAQDFFKSCMRLIEQEITIRQDECGQINPPGDFQRSVEHGAEMAPPRAACDNVGLRGRARSGRRAAGAGTDVELRRDGAYQLVCISRLDNFRDFAAYPARRYCRHRFSLRLFDPANNSNGANRKIKVVKPLAAARPAKTRIRI